MLRKIWTFIQLIAIILFAWLRLFLRLVWSRLFVNFLSWVLAPYKHLKNRAISFLKSSNFFRWSYVFFQNLRSIFKHNPTIILFVNFLRWVLTPYKQLKNTAISFLRYLRKSFKVITRKLYQSSNFFRWSYVFFQNLRSVFKYNSTFVSSNTNLLATKALTDRRACHVENVLANKVNKNLSLPYIDISVVVYNSENWIESFLVSLKEQDYPLSLINLFFIDHSSKKTTFERLLGFEKEYEALFSSWSITRQSNKGFGNGHDKAISISVSKFILIANVDLIFTKSAIKNAVKTALADRSGEYASWEFRQMPYEHPKVYDPVTMETNWSSHACTLLRREAYEAVGGYEPKIFMYAEDVELSYRFRANGWHLKYCPDAVVQHFTYDAVSQVKPLQFEGSTLGNAFIRFRYGNYRDKEVALFLLIWLSGEGEKFKGARKKVFKNIYKALDERKYFSEYNYQNDSFYPSFRGFDYEMIREGAFYEVDFPDEAPLVSVIVRTYQGREKYLKQCLMSIVNQTYKHIEILVVEDGGNKMEDVARSFCELASIKYYSFHKIGRSATGNNGMKNASGKYCVFLDDDDLFFSDHIEVLVSALIKNKKASAAYSLAFEVPTEIVNEKRDYVEGEYFTQRLFFQEFDYSILSDHNFLPIQSVLFERSLFFQRGGFDESLTYLEDWNLWLRYAHGNVFQYCAKTTSLYRTPLKKSAKENRNRLFYEAYDIARGKAYKSISQQKNNDKLAE